MKLIKTLLMAACLTPGMQAAAQSPATAYKSIGNGNPISPCVFCADPTAVECDGRLYVYGTNDHQQFIANGKKGDNNYGSIKSLVVFSTDDMVNWTFHGTIDVGKICGSWCVASWAPSIACRVLEDGTKQFFLYFANSGGSVGVVTANSPTGPFKSPLNRAMITGSSPGVSPCSWVFDPGVVIDENGTGWLAFGGGDPNSKGSKLQPGNARIAKLTNTMLAIDGSAKAIPAPYHFEASELNIMEGKFVYTYCTSWSDRDDWSKYGSSLNAPGTCSMCYMVSDDPLNPSSWEYKGQYLANPGTFGYSYSNNHTHLQKFAGNYYLFYHTTSLEQNMKTGASGFRSIGVNKAVVSESKQKVNTVIANNTGASACAYLNPFQLQQAETMSTAGGISYEDFTNIKKVPSYNSLGNDASSNLQVKMKAGAWTMVRNVNFGDTEVDSFMMRAKGSGTVEVRLGTLSAAAAAKLTFSSTDFEDHKVELDPSLFKGVRYVFLVFTDATNVQFDSWQFIQKESDGINTMPYQQESRRQYFDMLGRQLPAGDHHGIVVERHINADGTVTSRKRIK